MRSSKTALWFGTATLLVSAVAKAASSSTGQPAYSLPSPTYPNIGFGLGIGTLNSNFLIADTRIDAGAGIIYEYADATGTPVHTFNNPQPTTTTGFGLTTLQDGNNFLATVAGTSAFQIDLINGSTGSLMQTITNPASSGSNFGGALALSGSNLVVGAANGQTGAGKVYIYSSIGSLLNTISDPQQLASDGFANYVVANSNYIAVSSLNATEGAHPNAGAVYIYSASNGLLIRTLTEPTTGDYHVFGQTLALSGNDLLVDAADSGTTSAKYSDQGVVYRYNIATGALENTYYNPSPLATNEEMGQSLAFDGSNIVVGDPYKYLNGNGDFYLLNGSTGALIQDYQNPTGGNNYGFYLAVDDGYLAAPEVDADVTYVFNTAVPEPASVVALTIPFLLAGRRSRGRNRSLV